MKKIIIAVLFFCSIVLFSQPKSKIDLRLQNYLENNDKNSSVLVWVTFSNKSVSLAEANQNPEKYVSKESLKRRRLVRNENELLDFTDLPISSVSLDLIHRNGLVVKNSSKWFNSVAVNATAAQINSLSNFSEVVKIELVGKYKGSYAADAIPEQNRPVQPIGLKSPNVLDYGNSYTQNQVQSSTVLHTLGYAGQNVIVAVMDAGFNNLAHRAFDSVHIIATYDFVNHRTYVGDGQGGVGSGTHGTLTFSTLAGYYPGNLIGPAYKSKFILCKTENTVSETPLEEDNWIAAMEWADSIGAQVTSTSLSYLEYDAPYTSLTWQDMNGHVSKMSVASTLASHKGIIVCNSAGNNGDNPSHNTLGAPADADSILSVGSVDWLLARSSFSSVGNTTDGRIKPEIVSMGTATACASPYYDTVITYASGTSLSCPMIAGLCAQIISAYPNITPMKLRSEMMATASKHTSPDRWLGYGVANGDALYNKIGMSVNDRITDSSDDILYVPYPNPSKENVNIECTLKRAGISTITVYNLLGKKVGQIFEQEANAGKLSLKLDVKGYSSGVYFLELKTVSGIKRVKFVVAK